MGKGFLNYFNFSPPFVFKCLGVCFCLSVGGVSVFNHRLLKSGKLFDDSFLVEMQGESVELIGKVFHQPKRKFDSSVFFMRVHKVKSSQGEKKGKELVLIYAPLYPKVYSGQSVRVKCQLSEVQNKSNFDYQTYLFRYGVGYVCYRAILFPLGPPSRLQLVLAEIKSRYSRIFHEPVASVLQAMIWADKNGIPSDILQNISHVGLSHIIVISGMHIALISSLLLNTLSLMSLSRLKSLLLGMILLLAYVAVLGFPPAATRGMIMGSLVLLSKSLGRPYKPFNSLLAAAVIMLCFDPLLFYDVGFKLSFLATLGIFYWNPILVGFWGNRGVGKEVWNLLCISLSAMIMTLPLIMYYFNFVSLWAPLVNILVVPIIGLLIESALVSLVVSFVHINLGLLFGVLPWGLVNYFLKIVSFFSQIKIGYWLVSINMYQLVVMYIIIAGCYMILKNVCYTKKSNIG